MVSQRYLLILETKLFSSFFLKNALSYRCTSQVYHQPLDVITCLVSFLVSFFLKRYYSTLAGKTVLNSFLVAGSRIKGKIGLLAPNHPTVAHGAPILLLLRPFACARTCLRYSSPRFICISSIKKWTPPHSPMPQPPICKETRAHLVLKYRHAWAINICMAAGKNPSVLFPLNPVKAHECSIMSFAYKYICIYMHIICTFTHIKRTAMI